MTNEEAKKKKVCFKCKWCFESPNIGYAYGGYSFLCRNTVIEVNPVTGEEKYEECKNVNPNGECDMFDPKAASWWMTIFGIDRSFPAKWPE